MIPMARANSASEMVAANMDKVVQLFASQGSDG